VQKVWNFIQISIYRVVFDRKYRYRPIFADIEQYQPAQTRILTYADFLPIQYDTIFISYNTDSNSNICLLYIGN